MLAMIGVIEIVVLGLMGFFLLPLMFAGGVFVIARLVTNGNAREVLGSVFKTILCVVGLLVLWIVLARSSARNQMHEKLREMYGQNVQILDEHARMMDTTFARHDIVTSHLGVGHASPENIRVSTDLAAIPLVFLVLAVVVGGLIFAFRSGHRALPAIVLGLFLVFGIYGFLGISSVPFPGASRQHFMYPSLAHQVMVDRPGDATALQAAVDDFSKSTARTETSQPPKIDPPAATTPAVIAPAPATEKPADSPTTLAKSDTTETKADSPIKETPASSVADDPTRPAWIDLPSGMHSGVYRTVIKSGLFVTPDECQRALDATIERAVMSYVDDLLQQPGAARMMRMRADHLPHHIVSARYAETVQRSVGPMQQMYALLEINDDDRASFHRFYESTLVSQRLTLTGLFGGLLVAIVGAAFACLKADEHTEGRYRRRLLSGAAAALFFAVVGVILACSAISN